LPASGDITPWPWASDDERPGPACYCGRTGCIETFVSGPAMMTDHEKATGQVLAPPEIASLAEAGDGPCRETIARYTGRLALAVMSALNRSRTSRSLIIFKPRPDFEMAPSRRSVNIFDDNRITFPGDADLIQSGHIGFPVKRHTVFFLVKLATK